MSDDYEEDGPKRRVLSNRQVLAFIARHWMRRPGLFFASVALMLLAVAFDLSGPWAAGKLIDAIADPQRQADGAWRAWAVFVGIFLAFSVIRNVAFRFWNPMAARNMEEMTNAGFARVQSCSSDWHADTCAGATVRRPSGISKPSTPGSRRPQSRS